VLSPCSVLSLGLLLCTGQVPHSPAPIGLDTVRVTLENEIVATVDGPLALTRVRGLLPAPDGSLLVGQPEDRMVMLLSRDGDVVGRVGREGEGPGEFRWVSALGWRGDSLWVSDIRGRRITVFNSQFETVRTEPSPRAGVPIPFVPGNLVLLSDGSSLHIPGIHSRLFTEYGDSPPLMPITRHFTDATSEILAELPVGQVLVGIDLGGGARASLARPFSHGSLLGVSSDGRFVAYVRSIEQSGGTGSVVVRVFDVLSGHFDTLRTDVGLIPLTADLKREAIEEVRGRLGGLDARSISYSLVEDALNLPSTLPPVSKVMVSSGGSVFLRLSEISNTWLILRRGGRERRIQLPPSEELEHVSDSRLYTSSTGVYGLPVIREYSIDFEEGG
jgi:hypothetical protein